MPFYQLFRVFLVTIFIGVASFQLLGYGGLFVLGSLLVIAGLYKREGMVKLMVGIILSFFLGYVRIFITQVDFTTRDVAFYKDMPGVVKLEVEITQQPDIRAQFMYVVVEAHELFFDDKKFPVTGKILLKLQRYPEYYYGQTLELTTQLRSPPQLEGFAYAEFLAKDGIYVVAYDPFIKVIAEHFGEWSLMYGLKDVLAARINEIFVEPEASFIAGVLLGLRRSISAEIIEAFNVTGLTHILAISGYNITLLITIFGLMLQGFSRRSRFILSLGGVLLFSLLTGFSASVVRAAFMGALVLFASFSGRKSSGLTALLFSGACMVTWNPFILLADISFQLSFLATLGLFIVMPRWQKYIQHYAGMMKFLAEGFLVTMAAQVFTTPIILYNFGRFSFIAPVANILFLPLVPFIMLFSFAAIVSSFLFLPFTVLFIAFAWIITEILIRGVQFVASFPLASVRIEHFPVTMMVLYFVLVGLWLWGGGLRSLSFFMPRKSK